MSAAQPAPRSEQTRLFELLTRRSAWLHRRVDRTDLEPDGETTRRLSFDLTIPDHLAVRRDGGVVAPLTLFTKRPLRRLDTRGPDGWPLPVLGRQDNGELVTSMLLEAFLRAAPPAQPSELESLVRAAVTENDPLAMTSTLDALRTAMTAPSRPVTPQVEALLALTSDLVQQFVFAVLVPHEYVGRRIVLKVQVTEEVSVTPPSWALSPRGRSMDLPLALAESAASTHFEFRAPPGLRVSSTRLRDGDGAPLPLPGPSITSGPTAHLTGLERLEPTDGGGVTARIGLEPVADGLVRQTAWASGLVAVLFLAGALGRTDLHQAILANRGGAVAGAAFAVPALFLSVQARRPEHAWVARALFVPRMINVATAVVLYAVAIFIVTARPTEHMVGIVLWCLFAVQVALTALSVAQLPRASAEPPTLGPQT